MLLILGSAVPPSYNSVFSVFLPFTLKHAAILPYYLLVTLVPLPQVTFLPILGQISEYVSSPATSLSLSLHDTYFQSGEYWCSVGSYFCGQLVQLFPWYLISFSSTPEELKSCHSPIIIWDSFSEIKRLLLRLVLYYLSSVFCVVTFFLESVIVVLTPCAILITFFLSE